MPIAELATDLTVDGQVILPEGTGLTALEAHKHWEVHQQEMKFRCLSCHLPLRAGNVTKRQEEWKRIPYFQSYPDQKGAHRDPCPFAGESEEQGEPTGEFEVIPDKSKIPTRLVKRIRKSLVAPLPVNSPRDLVPEDPRTPRHEEPTSEVVKDFCNVYFEKIRGYPDPNDHRRVLQGLKFYLRGSDSNIGYAKAFWSVNSQALPPGYRIFYGPAKEIVKCSDGYVISYNIPRKYYDTWQPVVTYLPRDVLEEFDWGHHIQRMLVQDEINKTPWVYLCGRHELADHGIVIPLESVYWLHCAQHPCWSNKYQVRVSEAPLSHEEVLPTLFDRRLREFQQKFSSESRRQDSGINRVEAMPPQEPTLSQPNLLQPRLLIETASSPALQHASPEQAFTSLDLPRRSPLPEPEATHNEKRWPWYRKAINSISRLWEKL